MPGTDHQENAQNDCTDWLISYVRVRLGEHTRVKRIGMARLRAIVELTLEGLIRAPNEGTFVVHHDFESDTPEPPMAE